MKRSGWSSILSLLLWSSVAFCYPSAPGTCNMDLMGTIGHGPSKSACDDCYRIIIEPSVNSEPSSLSDILIHVAGTRAYQGLMLLVKNQANETVGQFVDFDEAKFAPVACDDEAIEEESVAVIGHIDPYLKSWPIQVGWRADESTPAGDFRVQGMVVIDYDNFHMIPEQSFKLELKKSSSSSSLLSSPSPTSFSLSNTSSLKSSYSTASTMTTTISSAASSTTQFKTIVTDFGNEEWPHESANPFFLHVIAGLMSIYVVMSIALRFILKSRRNHHHYQGSDGLVGNQEASESVMHSVKTS
ncbi:hypothetical protein BCR42DRAFT_403692 [Absidia repens]|uniref:Reelin domain-containing protein n=1 Tax=Absidia repens TaxID=90262 RepID=A0A1X2IVA5_9FUNG|nr:hypothetical protein BCR42DRAFT_403692 [Absidia repens]